MLLALDNSRVLAIRYGLYSPIWTRTDSLNHPQVPVVVLPEKFDLTILTSVPRREARRRGRGRVRAEVADRCRLSRGINECESIGRQRLTSVVAPGGEFFDCVGSRQVTVRFR